MYAFLTFIIWVAGLYGLFTCLTGPFMAKFFACLLVGLVSLNSFLLDIYTSKMTSKLGAVAEEVNKTREMISTIKKTIGEIISLHNTAILKTYKEIKSKPKG